VRLTTKLEAHLLGFVLHDLANSSGARPVGCVEAGSEIGTAQAER
jgi:hypothetical protein